MAGHRVLRIRELAFDRAWSRVAAARGHALAGVVYTVSGGAWGSVRLVAEDGVRQDLRYPEGTTVIVDGQMVHLPGGEGAEAS